MTLRDVIPYEKQADRRWCGAAALAMVYRSLGIEAGQPDIWARITHPRSDRASSAYTYRLGQDAIERGLDALVLRAREPWPILENALALSTRVIVNHRPRPDGANGHFSVLLDVTADSVYLHDPMQGENLCWPRQEFARLWGRPGRGSTGHVLIAIAPRPDTDEDHVCPECHTALELEHECLCRKKMRLRPAGVLGCWSKDCPRRTWLTLYCPYCDCTQPSRAGLFGGSAPFSRPFG